LPSRLPAGLAEAVHEAWLRLPDPQSVRVIADLDLDGVPAPQAVSDAFPHQDEGQAAAHQQDHKKQGEHHRHGHNEHGHAEHDHHGHNRQGHAERDQHGDADHRQAGHDQHHHGHGREEGHGHGDHGRAHDRHAMMAVTGEPSADGLVMESAEATVGPLSPSLPTGIVLRLTLDGDVVCEARVESALESAASASLDRLAPAASRWALERAQNASELPPSEVARQVAAVEVERALSHTMWLVGFARLLGWLSLADRLLGSVGPLIAAQRQFLEAAAAVDLTGLDELERHLGSLIEARRLRRRTQGLARLSKETCRERGAGGPVARASGLDDDLRSSDRPYQALDFTPVTRRDGDAQARAELRAEEALASLTLARAALRARELPAPDAGPIEGPRGPLAGATAGSSGNGILSAPSAAAHAELAAEAMLGHEFARALLAVSSFDLSPWAVSR
jgi:hypothetical protein